jgi:AraC family transcriptional regulator
MAIKTEEPIIKELDECTVAYVSFVGNYLGNTGVFKELIDKICTWAGPKGLLNDNTLFISSYQDDPEITPPEELKLDMCMQIADDIVPEGEIEKKTLPGGKYVVMHTELEDPSEYEPAWQKIVAWIKENNLEIDISRPSYELYLNNPEKHPKKHHIIEICMSIKE